MKIYDAHSVAGGLAWEKLIPAIAQAYLYPPHVPLRGHHDIDGDNPGAVTLLTMPAWRSGDYMGVKLVNIVPGNSKRGISTVLGTYVLMSAVTGEALAIIDAPELTARRTAATSALAASKLASKDSKTHLVVGTGKLAPYFAAAMRAVLPIRSTLIWGRNQAKANDVAAQANAHPIEDLQAAVAVADVVSCVTTTTQPLVKGAWLKPGTHLDLVGAFRPDMREADDDAIRRAAIFVDTREGALQEAGELRDPIERGVISRDDIQACLAELLDGTHPGRTNGEEITLFKSVGTAIGDYAAATCLVG